MDKATIILGNSSSITDELIQRYKFIVVPFKVDWPEGEGFSGSNIFEKMRDGEKKGNTASPKTSQPSIGAYKKAFEEALKGSESVICITIGSGMSGAYNSAVQAKKLFPEEEQKKIYVIDSMNADTGETLLAIKISELIEGGKSVESTVDEAGTIIKKIYLCGMVENPRWLELGGRLSHAAAGLLHQMQKIGMRPVLHIEDGTVKPANLKMNAKDTAEAMLKQFEGACRKGLKDGKRYRIIISHADNLPEAEKLKKLFEEKYPEQIKIESVSMAGLVIGAHVGPGTIIFCLLEE
jgi:DegV family protein with EDD domain